MNQDFRSKSYWMTTRDYTPGPGLAGDCKVDVAIVGGGFTGLSCAYFLKKQQPNMKVALLESEIIGYGASGRNGGFNMTLFGLTMGITSMRFGREKTREAHHYMERAVDLLRDLVAELKLDCDYEHPGFLRVATSETYKKRIIHEIELAHSLGLKGIEWIDAAKLAGEVRSPQYLGAWSEPRCGILNPAKLSWSWKEVVARQGTSIFEQTPVSGIARAGAKVELQTPKGKVTADKVVLATNAWSHFFPQLKRKQIPVWTHIVLTEPLKPEQFKQIGWQNRQGIEDARDLVHYYRLTADNRILMGGRDVSLNQDYDMEHDINEDVFAGLKKDVVDIFPALKGIRFTHQWGGPVSVPMDMAPAIGYAGDKNVVYSLGCIGHGVSMTHLNGQTVADLVLGKQTDLTSVFFVNRFTLPWPGGVLRRVMAKMIMGFMKYEDRRNDPKLPGEK
jgi:glycine/D-amino acid oxidase-like deaminating enzyme